MIFNPLSLLLTAVGAYMLFKLDFFFLFHPLRTLKKMLGSLSSVRAVKSLTLALAGTLGVGNVFGVCLGIIVGGRGSVFWLLISCVFASVLKYSEVVMSLDNINHSFDSSHGGMHYTLKNTFTRRGAVLAAIYSAACLLLSLVMGAALQSGTAGECMSEIFDTPPTFIGILLLCLVLVSIIGGVKIIERITVFIIPLTTIIYIIITLSVIILNINRLGDAVLSVVTDAFNFRSVGGGVLGFLFSRQLTEGYSRGILSNEAGAGTSSMAHSRSGILNPASAGLMGIAEVVFDTALLCMLTAFSVLVSVENPESFTTGMSLILAAVGGTLGEFSELLIMICVVAFAYSTIVCWYYYGVESFTSLFGYKLRFLFLPVFLLSVFLGALSDNALLVTLTDALMLTLSVLTLSALLKNSDRIRHLSEKGGVIDKSVKRIKGSVFSKEREHR